jgi:hypothetical protein
MTDRPPYIAGVLATKRGTAEDVLDHFGEDADLIVGLGNGEPATVLDALEASAERLSGVTVHQMLSLRERRYMHGEFDGLRHVSWFLSPANREAFHGGTCDLVPNNFSDVPHLMNLSTRRTLALTAASPPDRHGYFSMGPHAEYKECRRPRRHRIRRGRAPRLEHPRKDQGVDLYSPCEVPRRPDMPGQRDGLHVRAGQHFSFLCASRFRSMRIEV